MMIGVSEAGGSLKLECRTYTGTDAPVSAAQHLLQIGTWWDQVCTELQVVVCRSVSVLASILLNSTGIARCHRAFV